MNLTTLKRLITVAEEGNLTRAAGRLYISQPLLSRQIARIEHLVGVQLFARNAQGMELTKAGEAFCAHAREALKAIDDGVRDASRIANSSRHLTVGFRYPSHHLTDIIDSVAAVDPHLTITLKQFSFGYKYCGLEDDTADIACFHLPPQSELDVILIATEQKTALVAPSHRLAHRTMLDFADYEFEPLVLLSNKFDIYTDFWRRNSTRSDATPTVVQEVDTAEELLMAVSIGTGIGFGPTGLVGDHFQDRTVTIPLHNVPETKFVLAKKPSRSLPEWDSFAAAVAALRTANP